MEHKYIADHNVVARYVTGDLSPSESTVFEQHFVNCAQCLAEIEETEAFWDGLRGVVASDAAKSRWFGGALQPSTYLPWVAAAVFVICAIWLAVDLHRTRESAHEWKARYDQEQVTRESLEAQLTSTKRKSEMPASALIFPLLMSRSASASEIPNEVVLPTAPQWMILTVDRAGLPHMRSYHAHVEDAAGRVTWDGDLLQKVSSDTLGIGLQSELLREGTYALVIEGVLKSGESAPAGRYVFRVVKGK